MMRTFIDTWGGPDDLNDELKINENWDPDDEEMDDWAHEGDEWEDD